MTEEVYFCKCGTAQEPNDILSVSGRVDFCELLFTATFTCAGCIEEESE